MTSHSHPHEMKVYGEIKLFAGSGSPELSSKIAAYLDSPLCERELVEFPNENIFIRLKHSVRGQDVYVNPTNGYVGASQPHGVADHIADAAPGLGSAHHGRDSLLVLRAI